MTETPNYFTYFKLAPASSNCQLFSRPNITSMDSPIRGSPSLWRVVDRKRPIGARSTFQFERARPCTFSPGLGRKAFGLRPANALLPAPAYGDNGNTICPASTLPAQHIHSCCSELKTFRRPVPIQRVSSPAFAGKLIGNIQQILARQNLLTVKLDKLQINFSSGRQIALQIRLAISLRSCLIFSSRCC